MPLVWESFLVNLFFIVQSVFPYIIFIYFLSGSLLITLSLYRYHNVFYCIILKLIYYIEWGTGVNTDQSTD